MFIGRENELETLAALWRKPVASLVTCRGRRRIGKSSLVAEFARRSGARFLALEGKAPEPGMTNRDQLDSFREQLAEQTGGEVPALGSWFEAFNQLDKRINGRKTVVLLDEISWMGKYDRGFPGDLKIVWDRAFKKHDRLVMVLCGSVSTWITDNILKNTGFVGRRALDMVVRELPLADCVRFWGKSASRVAPREILDVLSVTGGVPKYLEGIDPGLSADENLRRMCFLPEGILKSDFDEIFSDVFGAEATEKRRILAALVDGTKTASEISAETGLANNGHLTESLEQLDTAGFAAAERGLNPATGRAAQSVRYRLRDNYARFFLRYVEPNLETIENGRFALATMEQLDGWDAILGLQLENLVLNHLPEFLPMLGLGRSLVLSAAPFRKKADAKGPGCQIDLLLQMRRSIMIVEIKRRREIGREIIREVEDKAKRLPVRRGMSVRTALVYDGHLAPAVEGDGFFDAVVPVETALRCSELVRPRSTCCGGACRCRRRSTTASSTATTTRSTTASSAAASRSSTSSIPTATCSSSPGSSAPARRFGREGVQADSGDSCSP